LVRVNLNRGATDNARPENAGLENDGQLRKALQVWKMQDWKITDKILANTGQNYGVWKMQDWKMTDHVNQRLCFLLTFLTDDIQGGF